MTIFWIAVILLVLGICYWAYMTSKNSGPQLTDILTALDSIEQHPREIDRWNAFIKRYSNSEWMNFDQFVVKGGYGKLLKLCQNNSDLDIIWSALDTVLKKMRIDNSVSSNQILKTVEFCASQIGNPESIQILKRLSSGGQGNLVGLQGNIFDTELINMLFEILRINFDQSNIRNSIKQCLLLYRSQNASYFKILYDKSLSILEATSSQEAKIMTLEFGRQHYAFLRPQKAPTIYDEQAIQNDIIVRSR